MVKEELGSSRSPEQLAAMVQAPYETVAAWARGLDVELLALAEHFGYDRMVECPVKLNFDTYKGSHINWKQIATILRDTLAIYFKIGVFMKPINPGIVARLGHTD